MTDQGYAIRLTTMGLLLLLLGSCGEERREAPKVVDGVIDLSDWDFEKDGSVSLEGDWHFWWEELLTPEELMAPDAPEPYGLFPVPSYWTNYPDKKHEGTFLPHFGYATLQILIKMPSNRDLTHAIKTPGVNCSKKLSITSNGLTTEVQHLGQPGKSKEDELPSWASPIGIIPLEWGPEIILTLQVSNHRWSRGGISIAPAIGEFHTISTSQNRTFIVGAGIVGVLLVMGIYHVLLFAQRRQDKASFWFGMLCFIIGSRQLATDKTLLDYLPLTETAFSTLARIEYLTMPLGCITSLLFFHYLLPGEFMRRTLKPLVAVYGLLSAFCIAGPKFMMAQSLSLIQLGIVAALGVCVTHLGSAAARGNHDARLSLMAILGFFVAIAWDIAMAQAGRGNLFIAPFIFTAFILTQSYILARRFAQAHRTAEHLTRHLQSEVDKQTQELWDTNESLIQIHEKEMESTKKALIQTEKLSQIGQLISSIGHEMASPIMLVSMTSDNTQQTLGKFEKGLMPLFEGGADAEKAGKVFQSMFDELKDSNQRTSVAAKRLRDVSQALRTQSRNDTEASPQPINEIINESLIIVSGRLKTLEVEQNLTHAPMVTCFRSRIGQVLTNLLANAADALHEKAETSKASGLAAFYGKIFVENKAEERDEKDGILITVSDNGNGVPQDIKQKIFDEFFTTKPAGQGTGLGLSMCAEIVRDHGGVLTITDSAELGGARFELWLPLDNPELEAS